jgi:hypothetical protein
MSSNKAFVAIRCVPLTVYEFVVSLQRILL